MQEKNIKTNKDLEKELGFTHYIETKGHEDNIKIDHDSLVDAFLKFNQKNNLRVVLFLDGNIIEELTLSLEEIERELRLLKSNEGKFCSPDDEELATSVGVYTNDYIAEFMQEIIFFSGKEEFSNQFSEILDEFSVSYFPSMPLNKLVFEDEITKFRKLGKNEACWCGSEKKYKKCCMNNDIRETGKVKKVPYNDYGSLEAH